jgi:PPOX class probable F420-dependent enzyme
MQKVGLESLGDLYEQPWLATLATYRRDDTVLLSPVWFEWDGTAFLVSLVHGDVKEVHIRRRPLVSLLIAEEASYPGRMLEVSGVASVVPDPNGAAITRIGARYLGEEIARRWVALYPDLNWDLLRLVPERSRALDHRNVPFLARAVPHYPPSTEWRIVMTGQAAESGSNDL